MPPHSDPACINSAKANHLECASPDFVLLLELIGKSRDRESYTWSQLSRIVQIGERYHFLHVNTLVHQPASRCIDSTNATGIFQFAAANEFPDLARLAIANFSSSSLNNRDYHDIALTVFDKMAPRYAAALVIAMVPHKWTSQERNKSRWELISAGFKV